MSKTNRKTMPAFIIFMKEYLKKPRAIGAVVPSSRFLAKKMMQEADFASCRVIIEYGPGTGVFTREIIRRKRKDTKLFLVDQNPLFCRRLKTMFSGDDSVLVFCGNAVDIKEILAWYGFQKADLIISGLPFTSLPKSATDAILSETEKILTAKGKFITFQYTLLKKKVFVERFRISRIIFEPFNIPPAFVFVMRQRKVSAYTRHGRRQTGCKKEKSGL